MRARFFHFVLREGTKDRPGFFFFFSFCFGGELEAPEDRISRKLRRWSLLPVPGTQLGETRPMAGLPRGTFQA